MHWFLHPVVRDAQAVSNQFGVKPKTRRRRSEDAKLQKSQISVLVLNAGTVTGEAANTSYLLTKNGFATKTLPDG